MTSARLSFKWSFTSSQRLKHKTQLVLSSSPPGRNYRNKIGVCAVEGWWTDFCRSEVSSRLSAMLWFGGLNEHVTLFFWNSVPVNDSLLKKKIFLTQYFEKCSMQMSLNVTGVNTKCIKQQPHKSCKIRSIWRKKSMMRPKHVLYGLTGCVFFRSLLSPCLWTRNY